MQFLIFRRMEGQDLRQTLVTLGLSIIFSDLMVWVWGGNAIQIDTPDYLLGPMPTPIVVAVKSSGEAVFLQYPRVRLVIFAAAVLIGIGMWLALNRTRIGVMIRAGVDDRDMLSVLGYRVQLLFHAGLRVRRRACGNGGHRRRNLPVDLAWRGFALSAGIAGSGHCRRHGIDTGRGARRSHHRPVRTIRRCLLPELLDGAGLRDHGHCARYSSAGPFGESADGVAANHATRQRWARKACKETVHCRAGPRSTPRF